jgi:hypothetical protein
MSEGALFRPSRGFVAFRRLAVLVALAAPPLVHTGCVKDAAYQVRIGQEARKHVYSIDRGKLVAAIKRHAEDEGWDLDEVEEGAEEITSKRKKGGRRERLVVTLVSTGGGHRVEADVESDMQTGQGKRRVTNRASSFELALLEDLEPKAASKARTRAKALAKEDTRMIRACARRAVDAATEDGE